VITGRYAFGALDDVSADLNGDSVKVLLVADDASTQLSTDDEQGEDPCPK
jgi:hypothetical protein